MFQIWLSTSSFLKFNSKFLVRTDEKWRPSIVFQSSEQVVVRQDQFLWVIKILEAQVGQYLLGCKCPVSRGIVVQEQNPLGDLTAAFFLQNVLHLHQQR